MSLFFLVSFSWLVEQGLWRAMRQERVDDLERRAKALTHYLIQLDQDHELRPDNFNVQVEEFSLALPDDYTLHRLGANEQPHTGNQDTLYTAVLYPFHGRIERLELSLSLEDAHSAIALLRRVLLPWALVAAAASLAAGFWLVRASLQPVRQLAEEAQSIGLEKLQRRVGVPGASDELRTLAMQWNDMLGRLESSVSRLRRFTSDASHELRTPLAVIRTTADVALRRERSGHDYQESLSRIRRQAEHTTRLVADLLDLARADENAPLPLTDMVNLPEMVAEAVDIFQPLAEQAQVPIETQGSGEPMLIQGNERAIRRVLSILLENAVAYGAPGPIRVEWSTEPAGMTVAISNPAPVLKPEDLAHLFDRFWRGDQSRNRASGGAGLGLSLAQEILRAHHGALEPELRDGNLTLRARFPAPSV